MPLIVNVGASGGTGHVDVDDKGLRFRLDLPVLAANVRLAQAFSCQWNQHIGDIPEKRVSFWYPCSVFPPKFCQGWTVIVPHMSIDIPMILRILRLVTSARVANTVIKSDGETGFSLCEGHLDGITPTLPGDLLFDVSPHIRGGLLMDIVQAPLEEALGIIQSTFTQVLWNVAAMLNAAGFGRQWSIFGPCK